MSNYIALNGCPEPMHIFAKSGEGEIGAFHADGSECKSAEFNIRELLDDELPQAIECPWCMKMVFETEHVRRCSGYQTPPTESEIRDAYSHPTEQAKRDGLLNMLGY